MALCCILDLITDSPFGGQVMYDILFLIAAGITGYMGYDCIKENR